MEHHHHQPVEARPTDCICFLFPLLEKGANDTWLEMTPGVAKLSCPWESVTQWMLGHSPLCL